MSETTPDVLDAWIARTLGVKVNRSRPTRRDDSEGEQSIGKGKGLGSKLKAIRQKVFKPKPPPRPAEAGSVQVTRAEELLKAMGKEEREQIEAILSDAPAEQKGYLLKAIASNHSAAEIEQFQREIAGWDTKKLVQELHVVGQSSGKGIRQQWSDSCGPTTIQAMKAELDPIYALELRKANPEFMRADDKDGSKLNKTMADEQKTILEANRGVAVSRDAPGGKGMILQKALTEQKSATGLKFDYSKVDDDDFDSSLDKMNAAITAGLPVPVGVTDSTRKGGHWILLIGIELTGEEKVYSFHDPWDGKMVKVPETQLRSGTFNIANWNRLDDIYIPSAE